jgi:hypothetical protein
MTLAEKHRVQLAAYREHPEGFVIGAAPAPEAAGGGLDQPAQKLTHQDAVGTTQTRSDDLRVVQAINTYEPLTRPGGWLMIVDTLRRTSVASLRGGLWTLPGCGKPWTASKPSRNASAHSFPRALGKPADGRRFPTAPTGPAEAGSLNEGGLDYTRP